MNMWYGKKCQGLLLRCFKDLSSFFFSSTRQNIAIQWRRCIKYGGSRVRVRAKTDDMIRIYFVLCTLYACVASVYVWFRSKERPMNKIFALLPGPLLAWGKTRQLPHLDFGLSFFLSFVFFFFFGRNFSSLKRLKAWSRTSMANARLNGLALAYIHKSTEIDGSSV